MRTIVFSLLITLGLLSNSLVSAVPAVRSNPDVLGDDKIELPRQIKKSLDSDVFPAMKGGNDMRFYDVFGKILSKASFNRIQAIEEYAESLKMKSPKEHFVDLKLMRVEQGIDWANDKMKLNEAIMLIEGINRRIKVFLDSVDIHPFMQEPANVSESWNDSKAEFWEAYVTGNEFRNQAKILQFGKAILVPLDSTIQNVKEQRTKDILRAFETSLDEFATKADKLEQGIYEAKLLRFRRSAKKIASSGNFENKFTASVSLKNDAEALVGYLRNRENHSRELLRHPGLAEEIKLEFDEVYQAEPAIVTKASLLRNGLYWWRRGRYGRGTSHAGLMKSEFLFYKFETLKKISTGRGDRKSNARNKIRDARDSWRINPIELNALYMPRNPPKPRYQVADLPEKLGARDGEASYYGRRHFYTWAIEDRPMIGEVQESESSTTLLRFQEVREFKAQEFVYCRGRFIGDGIITEEHETKARQLVRTTRRQFVPTDIRIPFRIVGSHEYLSAINLLELLRKESSPEEIAVYDKVIAAHEDCAFFSGVQLGSDRKQSYKKNINFLVGDQYKRQSLNWLLALARVELGATVAMYGGTSAFDFVAPDGEGRSEYYELLMGDLYDHMRALETDPVLSIKASKHGRGDSESIAYLRRLKIVNDMLLALRGYERNSFPVDEYLPVVNQLAHRIGKNLKESTRTQRVIAGIATERTTEVTSLAVERGTVSARPDTIMNCCRQAFLNRYGRE